MRLKSNKKNDKELPHNYKETHSDQKDGEQLHSNTS